MLAITGIDLSKILSGQTQILGENVFNLTNAWAFPDYWLPPKVCAYVSNKLQTVSVIQKNCRLIGFNLITCFVSVYI